MSMESVATEVPVEPDSAYDMAVGPRIANVLLAIYREVFSKMSNVLELVGAAASVATALGILLAGWQLRLTQRQAVTQFEDQLSAQYRELLRRLPLPALLGEQLDDASHEKALADFYAYFDLSNEQAFLRKRGRISRSTWANWQEGIQQNLRRPAFLRAWAEVSRRAPENFNDLRDVPSIPSPDQHLPHDGSIRQKALANPSLQSDEHLNRPSPSVVGR
jgi:hypothetical protein